MIIFKIFLTKILISKGKKTEVKAINVKINVDLDNGFKKIV